MIKSFLIHIILSTFLFSSQQIVLVVADDFNTSKAKLEYFEDNKFYIKVSVNKNENIDIVLMDINMPNMNGLEATKKIKKFMPKLSIIAQTAYSSTEDKEKALSAGCNDFISKPINKEELKTMVDYHLSL